MLTGLRSTRGKSVIWMHYHGEVKETDDDKFIPALVEELKHRPPNTILVFEIHKDALVTDMNLFNSSGLGTNPSFKHIAEVAEVGMQGLHKMFGKSYETALMGTRVNYSRYLTRLEFEREIGLNFENDFEVFSESE